MRLWSDASLLSSRFSSTGPHFHLVFSRACAVPAYLCVSKTRRYTLYSKNSSCLVGILFFFFSYGSIFSAVFGPKLGMRAMVQCRFSWGYVQIDILFETSLLRFSNLTSTLLFKITDTHIDTMLLHSQVFWMYSRRKVFWSSTRSLGGKPWLPFLINLMILWVSSSLHYFPSRWVSMIQINVY